MAWVTPRDWTGITDNIVTAAMLNIDIRDNLGVLSSHTHTGAAGMGATTMSGLTLTAIGILTFADQSANPDAAGELQRNGNDLLWYGAEVVNITQADASAEIPSLRRLGTTAVKAAAGNHTHEPASQATGITENGAVASNDSSVDMVSLTATPGATSRSWVIDGSFEMDGADGNTYTARLYFDATVLQTRTGLVDAGGANTVYGMQGFAAGPSVGSHTIKIMAQRTSGAGSNTTRGHIAFREVSA